MCNPVRESVFQTLQEKITNKETGDYDAMMISTGDSFTMFPDMVKNQETGDYDAMMISTGDS